MESRAGITDVPVVRAEGGMTVGVVAYVHVLPYDGLRHVVSVVYSDRSVTVRCGHHHRVPGHCFELVDEPPTCLRCMAR